MRLLAMFALTDRRLPVADQDHGRVADSRAAAIKRWFSRVVRYSPVRTEEFTVVGAI
jgi:hypothetical protein